MFRFPESVKTDINDDRIYAIVWDFLMRLQEELPRALMYYGVSAISLITTGSHQEGLRACTSFIQDHQYEQLEERMAIFAENHPVK